MTGVKPMPSSCSEQHPSASWTWQRQGSCPLNEYLQIPDFSDMLLIIEQTLSAQGLS